ncbi:hypothetical protein D9M69_411350 [compost metagenome]
MLVKSAQGLQPSIKSLVQLRPQCRGLVEELAGPIPHRGWLTRKWALSGEEFVEDDPCGEDVRCARCSTRLPERLGGHVCFFHQINNVRGNRQAAVHTRLGEIEVGDAGGAVLADQNRARRQVAVHHTVMVGMGQGRQQVFGHAPLLVQRQCQLGPGHVHRQRLARCIVQDQDEGFVVIGWEKIPRRHDVGMQRQLGQRPVGIGNAVDLRLAHVFRLVGVSLVHPQAGRATRESVLGTELRVGLRRPELFFHFPVPEALHGGGWLHHLQGMQDQPLLLQDILGEARRNACGIFEVALRVLQLHHPVRIKLLAVVQMCIGRGEQDGGIHIDVVQLMSPRIGLGHQALHGAGVAAQLAQRRRIGRAPLGVPLVAVHIDGAARALHVDQVQGVRRQQRDVDLEALTLPLDLEVVKQNETVWQAIPQVSDGAALCIVDRLAYWDHFRHLTPLPEFSLRACLWPLAPRHTLDPSTHGLEWLAHQCLPCLSLRARAPELA